jgi:NADH:ubiquinone oxidoreductase subunit
MAGFEIENLWIAFEKLWGQSTPAKEDSRVKMAVAAMVEKYWIEENKAFLIAEKIKVFPLRWQPWIHQAHDSLPSDSTSSSRNW